MGETSCIIFIGDEIEIYKGQGAFLVPAKALNYPVILSNERATKVVMNSPMTNKIGRAALRSCILQMIETYRESGIPRIEFPRWNEMLLYAVRPEGADVEYWCVEQVIDSFIDLYGPEFII